MRWPLALGPLALRIVVFHVLIESHGSRVIVLAGVLCDGVCSPSSVLLRIGCGLRASAFCAHICCLHSGCSLHCFSHCLYKA